MKEPSIVLELQQLATNQTIPIGDLLRKALVVSSKLKLVDFVDWIKSEMNGYDGKVNELPDHRKLYAPLYGRNPVRGLIPLHVPDPKLSEILNVTYLSQSAESLESLLNNSGDSFEVSVSPNQQRVLMNLQQGMVKFPAVYVISRGQLVGVLGFVRNRILNWALELEDNGILGSGYSFSAEEERKAMSNQNINIHNFQGMIGDVSNSTVTQNLNQFVSPGDFNSLANYLVKQGVDVAEVNELERVIAQDPRPSSKDSFGSGVSAWIGKMVSKAASGAWAISVAAAGALLGGALSEYYGLK